MRLYTLTYSKYKTESIETTSCGFAVSPLANCRLFLCDTTNTNTTNTDTDTFKL